MYASGSGSGAARSRSAAIVSNDIAEIWARIVAWLDDIVDQVPRPRLGEGEGRRWIRSY
jgi:hypothetical protein